MLNCEAVLECAKHRDIIVVPRMELETRVEVRIICFFPRFDEALKMHDIVSKLLPPIDNREDFFCEQLIMDEDDEISAHIDRDSFSIVSNLGFVPDYLYLHQGFNNC